MTLIYFSNKNFVIAGLDPAIHGKSLYLRVLILEVETIDWFAQQNLS
jgi:hypothetical protein